MSQTKVIYNAQRSTYFPDGSSWFYSTAKGLRKTPRSATEHATFSNADSFLVRATSRARETIKCLRVVEIHRRMERRNLVFSYPRGLSSLCLITVASVRLNERTTETFLPISFDCRLAFLSLRKRCRYSERHETGVAGETGETRYRDK